MRRYLILLGFALISIFLQLVLAPWMTIRDIRPDFVLILVLAVAQTSGRMTGQLFGFGMGLLIDAIGMGSFLGLSALTKTIAGFLAGFLKGQRNRLNPFVIYSINLAIIFLHFLLMYLINFKGCDISLQRLLIRYVLPTTLYSGVFYFLIDHFFPVEESS